ncbi:hypothetical protein NDU88_007641 [Pleurodeles waltl]|uniref:Uncharacterized protein n=1 Tax=Pleurodeles waltl TaxID=8319 RepID=A0AAV7U1Q2_PLEWA|nr:hypothetical protein NDU88_007641 [Pleurodeles waltl]
MAVRTSCRSRALLRMLRVSAGSGPGSPSVPALQRISRESSTSLTRPPTMHRQPRMCAQGISPRVPLPVGGQGIATSSVLAVFSRCTVRHLRASNGAHMRMESDGKN